MANQQQKVWKIPSGEITNLPYLEKIACLPIEGKKIIISTGMATIEEIQAALKILEDNGVAKRYYDFYIAIQSILRLMKM